jgi:dihydrodipicolinate synthase/N-acetylneuraminate lyase
MAIGQKRNRAVDDLRLNQRSMTQKRYPACLLANCCIPWNQDGSLADEILRREIRNLLTNLTRDIYIFGTAGEGYAVTDKQFDQIVRLFREETKASDVRGMVGMISLSLGTMIERIERAREMGVRYFQISLPGWGALSDGELKTFFRETCGRFSDCAFLHYNLMRTKRLVTPDEYAVLANEYPNLVAAKNSTDSMERIQGLMTKAPQLQHFFTETGFGYGSQLGECGFLISAASVHFDQAKRYFEAGQRQDSKALLRQQRELSEMINEIVSLGRNEAHMDGAFDKAFCKIHDPEFPLRLLPPYSGLSEETFGQICDVIRKRYPQWSYTT